MGIRTRPAMALIVIAGLLIGGVAFYLSSSQAHSRAQLRTDFERRTALAASLTAATIGSYMSSSDDLERQFGGPRRELVATLRAFHSSDPSAPASAVLDAQGHVLAVYPPAGAAQAASLVGKADVQRAMHTGSALSDIAFAGPHQSAVLRFSHSFFTPDGERTLVDVTSAQAIAPASAYLSAAPAAPGARAYLIDGAGRVLASSTGAPLAGLIPEHGLEHAIHRRASGNLGGDYFTSAPIHAGTDWRVVFVTSRSSLFAALDSSQRSDWLLFAAFVLAFVGLMFACLRALHASAQLTAARERQDAAQKLAHERLHDALTGLPNRALFLDRTEHALDRVPRGGWPLAVMFVDLDHFKRINDSLGHGTGDELLSMFGRRLRDAIRPSDTVSRFGGDEFLILCEELADEEDALRVASRIQAVVQKPFTVGERELHITCCVGVAIHRHDADRVEAATLVRDADAAMYSAKAGGRGEVRLFDEALHLDAVERLDTEVALRAAVEGQQLDVHYQPIVELPSGRTRGVEALARWTRPGVGPVPPNEFICLAEERGLIEQIGRWVLTTAMHEIASWRELGLIDDSFTLSVNVSPLQLANLDFPFEIAALTARWTLPPASLCLEITESAVVSDPEIAERALTELSFLGVQLAIDDFGVGQSSLEQLVHSLPVDILKLDRAFVADMGQTRERAVVAAVAPMAGDLGMEAIAEGVETADQAAALTQLGYPLAQGYHFGRPEGAAAFRAHLTAVKDRGDRGLAA